MRMNSRNKQQHSDLKMFNDFMSRGKISNAIRVLSDEHKGGVLAPTDLIDGRPVLEILGDKHPEGQPLEPNCIQSEHPRTLPYHPAVFDDPENEAILLIDAKNAFNVLNRRTALENVKALCPSLHVALQNSYSHPSQHLHR